MTSRPTGGVLIGITDRESAARLEAEGSILIDLRPTGAPVGWPVPGAIHCSDVQAWQELVTTPGCCWVLLYGGTLAACARFALLLPAGVAVLRVGEAAAQALTAAGPA